MALTITGTNYAADGPYNSTDNLKNASGVYIITGKNSPQDTHNILDIGESEDVKTRVSNHDRSDSWGKQGYSSLFVSALYCNEATRMQIEQELRNKFNPPCGKR